MVVTISPSFNLYKIVVLPNRIEDADNRNNPFGILLTNLQRQDRPLEFAFLSCRRDF